LSTIRSIIKVAHRGSPHDFPANTLAGFRSAVQRGCNMVEFDIRSSADGILVLAHDEWVCDRNGDRYTVAEEPALWLNGLDLGAGEGVPSLGDLVDLCMELNQSFAIMADMKCEGLSVEMEVARILGTLRADRKLIPGAGLQSRARFRELDPDLPLSLSCGRNDIADSNDAFENGAFEAVIESIDGSIDRLAAVTWEHPLLSARRIERLHERGLQVFAWTVDDASIMQRLIEDGVDGIISNRIDLLVGLSC